MSVHSPHPIDPSGAPGCPAGGPDNPGARVIAALRAAGCVFAEDEARLLIGAAQTPAQLAVLVDRRVSGLPLEQVLGWAEVCGLKIFVDPGVFVPRKRSEFLVSEAVAAALASPAPASPASASPALASPAPASPALASPAEVAGLARPCSVVVDLCCGTGAIGLAVVTALRHLSAPDPDRPPRGPAAGPPRGPAAAREPDLYATDMDPAAAREPDLYATDIDQAAVRCARRNLGPAGGHVYEGDLFSALPSALRGRIGVVTCNAPYVPTGEIGLLPPEARLHEPLVALDGGPDGVEVHRRVSAQAPEWLAPGGRLLIETSERQAPVTVAAMARSGLEAAVAHSDELDSTVVVGVLQG
jgi:release factor glutamine methyltransferase